jgi:hypothetical protein
MAGILRIEADWDRVTEYCKAFRDELVFREFNAKWPQHQIFTLSRAEAIPEQVDFYMNNENIDYITGVGHGEYWYFRGYKNECIWSVDSRISSYSGKFIHLLSCHVAGVLGLEMVRSGAIAFWGYNAVFGIVFTQPHPENLLDDEIAGIFLEMDCLIDIGILSGQTATEIYHNISQHVIGSLSKLDENSRPQLIDNYVNLMCPAKTWGDSTATL